MSELVTNFVFDLQRFATKVWPTDFSGYGSKSAGTTQYNIALSEIGAYVKNPSEIGLTWADRNNVLTVGDTGEAGTLGGAKVSSTKFSALGGGSYYYTFDLSTFNGTLSVESGQVLVGKSTKPDQTLYIGEEGVIGFSKGVATAVTVDANSANTIGVGGISFAFDGSGDAKKKNIVALDGDTFGNITLASKVVVTVSGTGLEDQPDVSINKNTFNLNTAFAYNQSLKSLTVDASEAGSTDGVIVSKTGNATMLGFGEAGIAATFNGSGSTALNIGGVEFAATLAGADGYFKVSSNAATGFAFGEAGDAFFANSGTPKDFKFYDATGSKEQQISIALNADAYKLAVNESGDAYDLSLGDGAKVTLGEYKFGVSLSEDHSLDSDTGAGGMSFAFSMNSKGVMALEGIGGVSGTWAAGDILDVEGPAITKASQAIEVGGKDLGVASGKFLYGVSADDTENAELTLTLKSITDSVFAAGSASKIAFNTTGEGTLTLAKGLGDIAKAASYELNIASDPGAAYFTLMGGGSVGFNFGGKGDAITLPSLKSASDGALSMTFTNSEGEATELTGVTVLKSPYTVTFTDNTTDAEQFEVSDLAAGAQVLASADDDEAAFTFGSVGGGEYLIANDSGEFAIKGITVAEGDTASIGTTGTALLASESTKQADWFQINGAGVNITAGTDDSLLVYSEADKSLAGLGSGAVVANAGAIEKIVIGGTKANSVEGITFGNASADSPQTYTVTSAKNSDAFFNVEGSVATGFQFGAVGDALTGDFTKLQLADSDGSTFTAPTITTVSEPTVISAEGTIAKVEQGFQVEAVKENIVAFTDGASLTFAALSNDSANVIFSNKGAVVSVGGVTEVDDSLVVAGATSAISIDGAVYEITGGEFTYGINDEEEVKITGLKSGVKVINSGSAKELWTASLTGGNGSFTFGSDTYSIVGADADEDGVRFDWDGEKVTGIGSLDKDTSIVGAMNGLKFNDKEEALSVTGGDNAYTLAGGVSLAGLKANSEVVTAGGISDFITDGEGKFTVLKTGMSIADDSSVIFKTDGKVLNGIDSLEGSAIGDFQNGLAVNGVSVAVTNDSVVAVVGDNAGVTAVNQLGVEEATTKIEVTAAGASVFGVNENGQFVFNGKHSFAVAGNGDSVTSFDFTAEQAAITGVDKAETLSGDFSQATSVDGNVLQVAGDSSISLVGGTQILGLTGGASVMQANGISTAVTDGIGQFTFTSGGESQAFEVSGSGDGVTFELDGKGKVVGISGIDEGEIVTGNLNGIKINGKEPEIIVKHSDGSNNINLYYENGTLSGVVDGDTVVKADNVSVVRVGMSGTFNFGENKEQFFTTTDANGVDFAVKVGTVEVTAVESLASGASLEGSIGGLSVNGKTVDIQDSDFGVVGADDGISGVYKLSDGAIVVDAAGATVASTDTVGKFTFGGQSGQSFTVAGDSSIDFALTDNKATAINGLSAGSVLGSFSGITGVNGKTFSVVDSNDEVEVFADADGNLSKIGAVTADATIGEVGSVSQVITDKAGKFEFTVGGQSFITGDGADVVTFGLSASQVIAIDDLNGSAIGGFSGIKVNGADIDIVDGDGQLKVFGNGTKLTAIQDVDADATINKAGGVAELVGNIAASSGTFTFANSGEFKVEGDSSVAFALNTAADAEVTGISDLSGNVTGSFSGAVSSINGKSFQVVDANGILTVYGNSDASDITKIASVTGGASIGQVGGVSQILTDKAGEFAFTNGSWSVAGDNEVTFGMSSSKVVSISELVGTVEGPFEDVTVNGKAFKISGDSSIALVGSASGVDAIEKLSGGAVINAAEGTLKATTDSDGLFTFADSKTLQVLGDSSVEFGLVDGKLVSIDGLDKTATIVGALNNIAINGASSMFDVRDNDNLWYSNGTLSAVVDGNTIVSADGATTVQVATDGTYTFGNDAFEIAGDKNGAAQFTVADSSIATAINGVDAGATVTGDLNGMAINGGSALVVENDNSFGAVAGDGVLAKLINLSGGANVVAAGGASQFVTDSEGQFTILGTAMEISGDDSVMFTAGATGITAIDSLEGTATGNFQEAIAVNGAENLVQVLGDSIVAVTSEGEAVTRVDAVDGGAIIAAVGGATEVGTASEGTFAFTTGGESQGFTVEGADEITFNLDEEGNVIGVSDFVEGKLTFDTATTALNVNDQEDITVDTTTNASFSIADSSVNYVTGVESAIEGLQNATVAATQAMEVNGKSVDVQGDNDYKVIVADGNVVGLADISDGATVNVAGVSIAVDTNGNFQIGENSYTFNDSVDNAFNLTTGEDSNLTGVDAFAGEMVIANPAAQSLTVNGDELGFASTAESVTVNSDGADINAVKGLVNADAIYGDLGSASMAMDGSAASVRGDEASFLTVNDVTYELLNDANGITVTGGRQVTDLDENASLYVSAKGKYTVNGNTSDIDVEDTNLPIIGLDGATDAYIYDPAHLIIRKGTPVSAIEEMLGLTTEYKDSLGGDDVNHETAGTADDPRTKEETDAIFGASSTVDLNKPLEIFATNDGKEAQNIPLAGTNFSKKVHLFNGDQNVTFNNAGGNEAIVESESSGTKNIDLGDMGDAVIMKADSGNGTEVNVVGGAGDDSVVVQGSAPVAFNMSEGGADKVLAFASSNARIALFGYDALANPNAGIHIAERWTKDFAAAIANGRLNFANGVMSIGNDPSANAQIDLGANIVNLFNYLGQKQAVGFTNDAGGIVDASTAQDPVILIGNDKGQKTGDSTLLGGSGDDTAIAGGGDLINLGDGNNLVALQQDINRSGAGITLAQGRTSMTGFIGSFNAQHGDMIATDLSNANVSFRDGNVYIEGENFYGVIVDAITNGELVYDTATDVTESADLVESADSSSQSVLATAAGDYTNVLFNDDGAISKTAIAKTGGTFDVKLDFDARANNYIGDDSGITFYDHTGEVLVNLAEGTGSIDTEAVNYSGITSVAAGAGQTTIIGADENETFIAGQGNDSIWGAGGKNLLLGYNDVANDKTGQTSFFVVAEADGAANTVRGFNFVDDDSWNTNTNQITADKLDIQVQYDYIDTERGGVDISGEDVVLFVSNRNKEASESVVIEGARGKDFVVSGDGIVDDVVAQVNTDSLVADKFANYFVATGKNATLTVGNDVDTANIYLGGRPIGTDYIGEVPQFYGDIHVIDASGSNAKVELGGNLYDNTIIGGMGDASLWGGDGGNDLLVGGTGANTFFYNAGDGDDTVSGAHDGDIVDLTNVTLSDIVDANSAITSSGVELKFKDGGSLTVNSTADVEYKVGEDTYVVNDDRDGWTKK